MAPWLTSEQNYAALPQHTQFYAENPQFWPEICSFAQKYEQNYATSPRKHAVLTQSVQFRAKMRSFAKEEEKGRKKCAVFCPNTQFCAKMASRLATEPPPNVAEVVAGVCSSLVSN